LQYAKQQLIWVPKELDINLIEEEKYKTFMQGLDSGKRASNKIEYIRGTKSELPQQIKNLAEQLKKQLLQRLLPGNFQCCWTPIIMTRCMRWN